MERTTRECEVASVATRWPNHQALPPGSDTALDVVEVFLEHLDRQTELPAQLIKSPLVLGQQLDDLLATRLSH